MKNQRVELHQNSILTMPYDFRDLFFPVFMNTKKKNWGKREKQIGAQFQFSKRIEIFSDVMRCALFIIFIKLFCFFFPRSCTLFFLWFAFKVRFILFPYVGIGFCFRCVSAFFFITFFCCFIFIEMWCSCRCWSRLYCAYLLLAHQTIDIFVFIIKPISLNTMLIR